MVSACSLKIPDAEVCFVLFNKKAACKFTVSGEERIIERVDWEQIQVGRFSLTPEDFAKYQEFIKQTCLRTNCTKEQLATVEGVVKRMEYYNGFTEFNPKK